MIAAIDSARLAAREDRATANSTQVQDQKFNAILNSASRRDPAKSLAKLERPVSPAEAQPRSIYGEAARPRSQTTRPEDRPEPREALRAEPRDVEQPRKTTGSGMSTKAAESAANADAAATREPTQDDQSADTKAAQQDKDKALNHADDLPPGADQIAGAIAQPGIVLTFKDIIAQSNMKALQQRSINVQLGAAAYQMSPHSPGEAALAEQMGAAPPPAFSQPTDPSAALDGRNAVRKQSELNAPTFKSDPVLVVDALAMVELSKQAQAARATAAQADLGKAPAGSAMSRDQFLAQIGGQTATSPTVASTVQAAATELKDVPKELLTPATDAPVKGPEGVNGTAVTPSGLATAPAVQGSDRPQSLSADQAPADSRTLDKVVQEARWMIRNNRQEMTMRLEPEHLGSMKLHVTHKDGTMHVEMTVDNAAAKHLLDSNMNQLRERFAQENLAQGSNLQVDVRHGGNSEFAQQFGRQGSEAGGSAAGIRSAAPMEEAAAATPRAAWSNSNVSIYA